MRVIVFGKTKEQSYKKLDALLETISATPIKIYRGDILYVAKFQTVRYNTYIASDNCCGVRCDKVYVPKDISIDIYTKVIINFLITSQLPHKETRV